MSTATPKQITESSILKNIVRKGTLATLFRESSQFNPYGSQPSSPRASMDNAPTLQQAELASQKDNLRLATKIWTAMGKMIRSQCNKGRIIDTLVFGTFTKQSTLRIFSDGQTSSEATSANYIYCPGPKSIFSIMENSDNVKNIPQQVSLR